MSAETTEYVNTYDRKGGRGLRPWLLIPKVLSVAVFAGAYTSATLLWFIYRKSPGEADWCIQAVSILFRKVVVPSLISTLLFGILLFAQHPKVFIKRRWLQLKLIIVIVLPLIHLRARGTFEKIKARILHHDRISDATLESLSHTFSACLILGLLSAVALLILGRLKPRLWQHPQPISRKGQAHDAS